MVDGGCFIVGIYIATFVRDLLLGATSSLGISIGKFAATVVFYLLVIIVSLTSLQQAGVDTTIITSNLLLIVGTILVSGAISYGLASRDVLANVLASYFNRKSYKKGMRIAVDGVEGEIELLHSTGILLNMGNGMKVNIPADTLIKQKVEILE